MKNKNDDLKSVNKFIVPAMIEYLKQFDENPLKNIDIRTDVFDNYGSGELEVTIFVKPKEVSKNEK